MSHCQDDLTAVDLSLSSAPTGGRGATTSHYSLYPFITHNQCLCLNAEDETKLNRILRAIDTKDVVKSNDEVDSETSADNGTNLNWPGGCLSSHEGDDELIVHVQFSQLVKVKSVLIGTGGGILGTSPQRVRAFVNHADGIDFQTDARPDQEWELLQSADGHRGSIEYPVRLSKFSNVKSLDLFFFNTPGGERSVLYYLGFMGESKTLKKEEGDRMAIGAEYKADQQIDAKEEKRSGWSAGVR